MMLSSGTFGAELEQHNHLHYGRSPVMIGPLGRVRKKNQHMPVPVFSGRKTPAAAEHGSSEEESFMHEAATKVQATYRGHMTRKNLKAKAGEEGVQKVEASE